MLFTLKCGHVVLFCALMNGGHASSVAIQPEGHSGTHFYSCLEVCDGAPSVGVCVCLCGGGQEPSMVPYQFAIQIKKL